MRRTMIILASVVALIFTTFVVINGAAQAAVIGCVADQENWQDPGRDGVPNTMLVWPDTEVQYSASQQNVPDSGSTCTQIVLQSYHSWSSNADVCANVWVRYGPPGGTWRQGPVRGVCPGSARVWLADGIPDSYKYRIYVDVLHYNPVIERFPVYIRWTA